MRYCRYAPVFHVSRCQPVEWGRAAGRGDGRVTLRCCLPRSLADCNIIILIKLSSICPFLHSTTILYTVVVPAIPASALTFTLDTLTRTTAKDFGRLSRKHTQLHLIAEGTLPPLHSHYKPPVFHTVYPSKSPKMVYDALHL